MDNHYQLQDIPMGTILPQQHAQLLLDVPFEQDPPIREVDSMGLKKKWGVGAVFIAIFLIFMLPMMSIAAKNSVEANYIPTVNLFIPDIPTSVPVVRQVLSWNNTTTAWFVACGSNYNGLCQMGNGMTITAASDRAQFTITPNCETTVAYDCAFPGMDAAACTITQPSLAITTEVTRGLAIKNSNSTEVKTEEKTTESTEKTTSTIKSTAKTSDSTSKTSDLTTSTSDSTSHSPASTTFTSSTSIHISTTAVTVFSTMTMYYSGTANVSNGGILTHAFSRMPVTIIPPAVYRIGPMAAPLCQPADYVPSTAPAIDLCSQNTVAFLLGISAALITVFGVV